MHAIWKGAISFGLVSISVRLSAATEDRSVRFHQVHRADGGRVRHRRVCSACDSEVALTDIIQGWDAGGGELVTLSDEDVTDLPLPSARTIDVLKFVPGDEVDPILYRRTYFLEPEAAALKPYALLREALRDAGRVAIVKIALRRREQLAAMKVRGDVIVLHTMRWPDELRTPDFGFLDGTVEVKDAELAMAASLIDSMSAGFDPVSLTDDHRAALQAAVEARRHGRPAAPADTQAAATRTSDLMAALAASVDRARERAATLSAPADGAP
ncbi:Ku protein [Winogradskya consettensis]|uniref:Non-homologous end joining protein Ku n=1 Tax=Winogradskya consettensis TaxID=113560 RepID=A0A919W0X0_9ACTN|nr:Ku protein [Actinoplanes consettensis]GIM82470.1 non-homologous end joining protein Ku [Actinoplanes consettensis]